ncbi:MAG: hypothetical protein JNN04_17300 [Cyclobacteriaceae bacterium]|nr:hypothetical protein [Cyclobacteriaceae bacterium]
MEILIHILGWSGSVMVIAAYGLNSYQKLASDSMAFLFLNLVGGILLIIYSAYFSAFANTFINVVWVIIAVPAIVKKVRKPVASDR